jgi:hypothetical protein
MSDGESLGRLNVFWPIAEHARGHPKRRTLESGVLSSATDLKRRARTQQIHAGPAIQSLHSSESPVFSEPATDGCPVGSRANVVHRTHRPHEAVGVDPRMVHVDPRGQKRKDAKIIVLHPFDGRGEESVLDDRVSYATACEADADAHQPVG